MLLTLILACTSPPATVAKGPSIVWISLDTTRADALGVYGGRAATPTLDGLAKGAVVYERAYSHFPETGLSHWTLFTGVLPEVHGNVPAAGQSAYTGPTAAELAKAQGYATGAFIGGITMLARATGLERGFDTYDDQFTVDPADMKRDGDDVIARAVTWIDARPEGAPYFAFVHLFDAHFPYTPDAPRRYAPDYAGTIDGSEARAGGYRDMKAPIAEADLAHVRALYDAELTELDAALAPLLAAAPDAIVMVTADHGESFEHGYLFNHRGSLADGVMHIPWILRAPGLAPARVDTPVAAIDVLPTLAAAAGWDLNDAPVMGRSVLSSVTTASRVWARTDPWFTFPLARGWKAPLLALRTEDWKVVWDGDGATHAFDLRADPGEATEVPAPAELAGARSEYEAALASMAPYTKKVEGMRPVPFDEHQALESLGYTSPGGHRGPPGGRPMGPPPGGPGGQPPGGPGGPQGPAPGASGFDGVRPNGPGPGGGAANDAAPTGAPAGVANDAAPNTAPTGAPAR